MRYLNIKILEDFRCPSIRLYLRGALNAYRDGIVFCALYVNSTAVGINC